MILSPTDRYSGKYMNYSITLTFLCGQISISYYYSGYYALFSLILRLFGLFFFGASASTIFGNNGVDSSML